MFRTAIQKSGGPALNTRSLSLLSSRHRAGTAGLIGAHSLLPRTNPITALNMPGMPGKRFPHTPTQWQKLYPTKAYPKQYISIGGTAELMIAVWADMHSQKIFDGTGTSAPQHTVYTGTNWIVEADEGFRNTIPAGQLWSEFPPMFKEVVKEVLPNYRKHLVGDKGYIPLGFYAKIREACIQHAKKVDTLEIVEASADSIKVSTNGDTSLQITNNYGASAEHKLAHDVEELHFVNNATIPNKFDAHARLAPTVVTELKKSPELADDLKKHGATLDLEKSRIRIQTESMMDRARLPIADFYENADPVATAIYVLGTSLSSNWASTVRKMHAEISTLPSLKPGGDCNEIFFGTNDRRINFVSEYKNINGFNKHPYFNPKEQKVTINTDETDQGILITSIRRLGGKFYYTVQATDLDGSTHSGIISESGFVSATGSRPFDLPIKGVDEAKKLSLVTTCRPTDIYKSNKNHPRGSLPYSFEFSSHLFGLDKIHCKGKTSIFPMICDGKKRLADLAQRVHHDFELTKERVQLIVKKYMEYRHSTDTVPSGLESLARYSELIFEAYKDQYGEQKQFDKNAIEKRILGKLSNHELQHLFFSKRNCTHSPAFDEAYTALHAKHEETMRPKP